LGKVSLRVNPMGKRLLNQVLIGSTSALDFTAGVDGSGSPASKPTPAIATGVYQMPTFGEDVARVIDQADVLKPLQ